MAAVITIECVKQNYMIVPLEVCIESLNSRWGATESVGVGYVNGRKTNIGLEGHR
jgi:hypothetical protein